MKDQISADTTDWLDDNVNPVGSAVIVDKTLTIEGAAADAKAVKTELDKKANASNTYTKAEVNAAIDAKQIEVDDTLSIAGMAADAKAVGDEFSVINESLTKLETLKTDVDDIIQVLSDIPTGINNGGAGDYNLFNSTLMEILFKGVYSANMREQLWEVYLNANRHKMSKLYAMVDNNASSHDFYIGDDIDSIRPYIVVTAETTDGYTVVVKGYNLTGSLSGASNTITVEYLGFTATVTINAITNPSGIVYDWDFTTGLKDLRLNREVKLIGGASQDSSGLRFNGAGQSIEFFDRTFKISEKFLNKTIQVHVSSFSTVNPISHYRFLLFADPNEVYNPRHYSNSFQTGIIYRKDDGWKSYFNAWRTSVFTGMTSPNAIAGKVLSLYISNDGSMTLYLDGTSKGTITEKINAHDLFGMSLGSTSTSSGVYDAVVSKVRIFNGRVVS